MTAAIVDRLGKIDKKFIVRNSSCTSARRVLYTVAVSF